MLSISAMRQSERGGTGVAQQPLAYELLDALQVAAVEARVGERAVLRVVQRSHSHPPFVLLSCGGVLSAVLPLFLFPLPQQREVHDCWDDPQADPVA